VPNTMKRSVETGCKGIKFNTDFRKPFKRHN
jgi:hypothetical protein